MLELKGKGLFVFSDPGGARGVLAKVYELKEKLDSFVIISDRKYDFVQDFGLEVLAYNEGMELELIQATRFDFVYTGTSYTSNIELKFLKAAKSLDIFTSSFVDHWMNFKNRFIDKFTQEYILPNCVFVIDETCVAEAQIEGLPSEKLKVSGHPYHDFLKNWKPIISRNDFALKYDLSTTKKWIVYAPDPLTNVGGKEKWGVDEKDGLGLLIESLKKSKQSEELEIILKPHPNQNLHVFEEFKNLPSIKILNAKVPSNELIYYSALLIGYFSNILFESNLLGTRSISLNMGKNFASLPSNSLHQIIKSELELIRLLDEQ